MLAGSLPLVRDSRSWVTWLSNSPLSYRYVVAWTGTLPCLHNRGWPQSFTLLVAFNSRTPSVINSRMQKTRHGLTFSTSVCRMDVLFNSSFHRTFPVVFELVSAYGGVGLSVGLPYVRSNFISLHAFLRNAY